jgi:glycosyltransferase involved in cell wall biosynthesis
VPRADVGLVQILFSGSLTQAKGVLDLIEVARVFRNELAGVRIIIIGTGDLAAECERRIRDQGLRDIVELHGFVDDADKDALLMSSHIYCLPSYSEGTPLSVLEAMASGLPIVSTTVGGVPYVAEQGVHGWLVPPGDVDGLGRAILNLVGSAAVRTAMGKNGFERVRRRFDIGIVANSVISRLNGVAGSPAISNTSF